MDPLVEKKAWDHGNFDNFQKDGSWHNIQMVKSSSQDYALALGQMLHTLAAAADTVSMTETSLPLALSHEVPGIPFPTCSSAT